MKITLSLALFTPELLDTSCSWLCTSRKNHPADADIWDLRFHWQREKVHLLQALCTDIRGYYANIDKDRLYHQLPTCIPCPGIRSLLWQFLHYSVEDGGNFHTPVKGIPRASSLSPLLAAFHLYLVDKEVSAITGVRYARYMDDFIIITTTRHKLRRAVKILKQRLHECGFVLHPDKTQQGRTRKGFDWMGLWFTDKGITAFAPRATEKHRLKCRQLYEHIRHLSPEAQAARMANYVRRWGASLPPLTR